MTTRSPFFSDEERRALGALANVVIPSEPDAPGGGELGAAVYIERLLTGFDVDPPAIFADGPYSGRQPLPDGKGGAGALPPNDFIRFRSLDRVAEKVWRIRLYGSKAVEGGALNEGIVGLAVGLRDVVKQFDGIRFKRLMQQSPGRDRITALVMQAEDAPQLTNRVDLDPAVKDLDGLPVPRITYSSHAFELHARDVYAPKLMALLQASGARFGFVAPKDDISASAHVMGTLRSGLDPKTSVTDAAGRFHGVDNLYASDGSLFPTSSGYNPTHTIVSLATRVAGEMVFPGSSERVVG